VESIMSDGFISSWAKPMHHLMAKNVVAHLVT
jgi:hypothetical protein